MKWRVVLWWCNKEPQPEQQNIGRRKGWNRLEVVLDAFSREERNQRVVPLAAFKLFEEVTMPPVNSLAVSEWSFIFTSHSQKWLLPEAIDLPLSEHSQSLTNIQVQLWTLFEKEIKNFLPRPTIVLDRSHSSSDSLDFPGIEVNSHAIAFWSSESE